MGAPMNHEQVTRICREATACRSCFDDKWVEPAATDIAQPRWVGPEYSSAALRVVCVLLNPAEGAGKGDSAASLGRMLISDFASGSAPLTSLFEHQGRTMPTWKDGRFLDFYTTGLGLRFNEMAFANVAWCASKGNKYPDPMLLRCFQAHTLPLLVELQPDVVLLSGSKTHPFMFAIGGAIPDSTCVDMLHCAHRKGRVATQQEHARIRTILEGIRSAR